MRTLLILLVALFSFSAYSQVSESTDGLKVINGTSIFVKTLGTGEPVLFIHGGPGLSHDYFLPHVAALSDQLKLILYDQRGCGRSDVNLSTDDMTMAQFLGDINALLTEQGIGKVHLFGHSFGGLIAMQFAIAYPDKIKSLILCNSVAASKEFDALSAKKQREAMTDQDNQARSAIFASDHFKNGKPEAYELLFKIGFKRSFYDTLAVDKLELHLMSNFSKTSKLLYGLSPDLVAYDLHPALAKLSIPSLVIHGSADLIPDEVGKKLAATLPNAQYVVFEKSGHFPFIEEPDAFTETITSFVKAIH